MTPSRFIRAMHPRTAIQPKADAIARVLQSGWAGQWKIHGHRAQIHIPPPGDGSCLAYNRQGALHRKKLPEEIDAELSRLFAREDGWTVIDSEWLKGEDRIFVFDILRAGGVLNSSLTYAERYEQIPRVYRSSCIETLPLLMTVSGCMAAVESAPEFVEGLVFRALHTRGFQDTSIIRCRWPDRSPHA